VKDAEWGWCAGFTSWCAMQAGVPRESLAQILEKPEGISEPVFSCSAVSPGKLLRAFQHMHPYDNKSVPPVQCSCFFL
jgi:hypothetical protein